MTTGATSGFRTIDVGAPRERFARGWHCLGLAEPFRDGKPHAIEAFGTKLVVFATGEGTLNVLDAYCRHMGGDLSQGSVKGETIACPFHDWRWAGNGRCVRIPYAKRIPLRARTRSWLTLERNKQLFVWHDPEGNPPPEDVVIPAARGASGPEWSEWTWDTVRIDGSNCREIIDNMVDMAHFFYIHFAFPTYFRNVFDGHVATQYLNSRGRPDVSAGSYSADDVTLRSEASYYGPSYMINDLWQDYHGTTIETVLINCHSRTAAVKVILDGTEHRFDWPAETKLLDLLLDRGLDAPYSCREGACGACACRLVSGEVKMLNNDVLEDEDLADGIRLACQSLPVTDEVEISYE